MHMLKTSAAPTAAATEPLPGIDYWCGPRAQAPCANVLTIDLEDWPVAVLGPHHEVTGRVVENTLRCLQVLRWHNVKATFFVLTKVAVRFGDLIREVHAAGHEIASHGHGHELLTTITPERFKDDVRRSLDILGELVGYRPLGYRAPGFSIVESTRWAGPILADLGLKYSSSIFPIRHPRYGIPGAPRHIHRWKDCGLIECPPATFRCLRRNLPVAGGGYFRLLPGAIARLAIRRINRRGMPAILYLHPYELDIEGIREHKLAGVEVGRWRQFTQGLFRNQMEGRVHRLLESSQFVTMRDLLQEAIRAQSVVSR
jgi:polysaccharide deacetylase family protein (PEP-CTERM system associated)